MSTSKTIVYKEHPYLPFYISECGTSVKDFSGLVFSPTSPKTDNYSMVLHPDANYPTHRMVCETFHENPEEKAVVNHKDGNKKNNHKDNLEWVTYSENLDHAYKTGLRGDNTPVRVKDIRTDEITEYYSLQKVASEFNVNGEKVHRWLNSKNRYPFEQWYDLSYKDKDFKGLTKDDFGTVPNGAARSVVAIDKNGDLTLFESLGLAALSTGISKSILYGQVSEITPRRAVGDKGYMMYYLDQYNGTVPDDIKTVLIDRSNRVLPTRKPDRVRVQNLLTGNVQEFDDIGDFAKLVGRQKSSIQKYMNKGHWGFFKLEYVDRD